MAFFIYGDIEHTVAGKEGRKKLKSEDKGSCVSSREASPEMSRRLETIVGKPIS